MGHAPGQGKGQVPAAGGPYVRSGTAAGTFKAPAPGRGFDAATSTLDASGATATSDLYDNADGSETRKAWSSPVNYGVRDLGADQPGRGAGGRRPLAREGELAGGELRRKLCSWAGLMQDSSKVHSSTMSGVIRSVNISRIRTIRVNGSGATWILPANEMSKWLLRAEAALAVLRGICCKIGVSPFRWTAQKGEFL